MVERDIRAEMSPATCIWRGCLEAGAKMSLQREQFQGYSTRDECVSGIGGTAGGRSNVERE